MSDVDKKTGLTARQYKIFCLIHGIGGYIILTWLLSPTLLTDYLLIAALSTVFGIIWTRLYSRFWSRMLH